MLTIGCRCWFGRHHTFDDGAVWDICNLPNAPAARGASAMHVCDFAARQNSLGSLSVALFRAPKSLLHASRAPQDWSFHHRMQRLPQKAKKCQILRIYLPKKGWLYMWRVPLSQLPLAHQGAWSLQSVDCPCCSDSYSQGEYFAQYERRGHIGYAADEAQTARWICCGDRPSWQKDLSLRTSHCSQALPEPIQKCQAWPPSDCQTPR